MKASLWVHCSAQRLSKSKWKLMMRRTNTLVKHLLRKSQNNREKKKSVIFLKVWKKYLDFSKMINLSKWIWKKGPWLYWKWRNSKDKFLSSLSNSRKKIKQSKKTMTKVQNIIYNKFGTVVWRKVKSKMIK